MVLDMVSMGVVGMSFVFRFLAHQQCEHIKNKYIGNPNPRSSINKYNSEAGYGLYIPEYADTQRERERVRDRCLPFFLAWWANDEINTA